MISLRPTPALLRRARFGAALAVLGGLSSGCELIDQLAERSLWPTSHPTGYQHDATGITFPDRLHSLRLQPAIDLESDSPGLGIALRYANARTRMDCFIYDLEQEIIPDGIESDIAKQSFADAHEDLRRANGKGLYARLQAEPQREVEVDGITFLVTRFSYEEDGLPHRGFIALAGVNTQLLKIRFADRGDSELDPSTLLQPLCAAILRSRQLGYGGVDQGSFLATSRTLSRLDLSDGLSAIEAISIAQRHVSQKGRHNRYDLDSAHVESQQLPGFAVIEFYARPDHKRPRKSLPPLRFRVDRTGAIVEIP